MLCFYFRKQEITQVFHLLAFGLLFVLKAKQSKAKQGKAKQSK